MRSLQIALVFMLIGSPACAGIFGNCGILDPFCGRLAQEHDQLCRSYGAAPGTPAYVACRARLKAAHDVSASVRNSGPSIMMCQGNMCSFH